METKQVIVIRKDLNMRKGKIAAQAAHASMKIFFDRMTLISSSYNDNTYELHINDIMDEWKNGLFTKICVYVNSEEELIDIYNKAIDVNLPVSLIVDSGLTEFNGIPTKTCVAIGPSKKEWIDEITKHLPLL